MKVLLIILAVILFFIAVLSVPFHVYSEYIESFVLYVRWLFIKIYIYPPDDKKKKKKKKDKKKKEEDKDEDEDEEEEEEKEKEPKDKGDNFIKVFYDNQGVPGIINLVKSIAKKLKKGFHKIGKSFYIRKLWLRINVAEGDSAETAIKYGKICSALYPSLGYIIDCINAKNCSVKVQPDFLGKKTEGGFSLHLFVIPSKLIGSVIKMGLSLGFEILKIFISNAKSKSKSDSKSDSKGAQKTTEDAGKKSAEAADKNAVDDKEKTQKGGKI